MKGALVCANGVMKNYRYGFDNFVKNLVEFNDLDVYLFLQKNTSTKIRGSAEPDIHDEESYLREKLGHRLKMLYWTNEDLDFQEFRNPLKTMHENRIAQLTAIFKDISPDPYLGSNDYVADQYIRLAHACRKFQEYCESNQLKYNYVIRFRVDITVPIPFPCKNLRPLHQKELYAVDGGGFSIRDALFITTQEDIISIAKNFVYEYGTFKPPLRRLNHSWLAPECQLAQFLLSFGYKVYNLRIHAEQSPLLDVNTISWYSKSDFLEPLEEIKLISLSDESKEKQKNSTDIISLSTTPITVIGEESNVYMILMIVFLVLFFIVTLLCLVLFFYKKTQKATITNLPSTRFL